MSKIKLANSIVSKIQQGLAKGARPQYTAALGTSVVGIPLLGGAISHELAKAAPISNKAERLSKWYDDVVMPNNRAKMDYLSGLKPKIDQLRDDLGNYDALDRMAQKARSLDSRFNISSLAKEVSRSGNLKDTTLNDMMKIYEARMTSPEKARGMFNDLLANPINALSKQVGEDYVNQFKPLFIDKSM